MAKPTTWLESLLIWSINHAPNGCQSQGPSLQLPILVMQPPTGMRLASAGGMSMGHLMCYCLYLRKVASN